MKFFQNIDKAFADGDDFTQITLMLAMTVICLFIAFVMIGFILNTFGVLGLIIFTMAILLSRIVYAGVFAK